MSDRAAFLRAIVDAPDDDAPRLVFADWLDEQGEHDRAEFIRVQCALAACDIGDERRVGLELRQAALLRAHGEVWGKAEAPKWCRPWLAEFQRGFVNHVQGTVRQFCKAARGLARSTVTSAALEGWKGDGAELLAARPELVRLRALTLRAGFGPAPLRSVLTAPALTGLRELTLSWGLEGPADAESLFGMPALRPLESLHLPFGVKSEAVTWLLAGLASTPPPGFRRLHAECHHIFTGPELAHLLGSAAGAGLESLRLTLAGADVIAALTDAPPSGLRSLRVGHSRDSAADWGGMFAPPALPTLADLRVPWLTPRSAALLVSSVFAPGLRELDVVEVTPELVSVLAESPRLAGLCRLWLRARCPSEAGIEALARSPHLLNLRHLRLPEGTPPEVLSALHASPHLPALEVVTLDDLSDEFATDTLPAGSPYRFAVWKRPERTP